MTSRSKVPRAAVVDEVAALSELAAEVTAALVSRAELEAAVKSTFLDDAAAGALAEIDAPGLLILEQEFGTVSGQNYTISFRYARRPNLATQGMNVFWNGTAIQNVKLLLTHWRVAGIEAVPSITLEHSTGPRLAYALPILTGMVATVWLR